MENTEQTPVVKTDETIETIEARVAALQKEFELKQKLIALEREQLAISKMAITAPEAAPAPVDVDEKIVNEVELGMEQAEKYGGDELQLNKHKGIDVQKMSIALDKMIYNTSTEDLIAKVKEADQKYGDIRSY